MKTGDHPRSPSSPLAAAAPFRELSHSELLPTNPFCTAIWYALSPSVPSLPLIPFTPLVPSLPATPWSPFSPLTLSVIHTWKTPLVNLRTLPPSTIIKLSFPVKSSRGIAGKSVTLISAILTSYLIYHNHYLKFTSTTNSPVFPAIESIISPFISTPRIALTVYWFRVSALSLILSIARL